MGLKQRYLSWMNYDPEFERAMSWIQSHCDKESHVLDVGCGYGRLFVPLHDKGYTITGVDANPDIVDFHRNANRACISVNHLRSSSDQYDLIIMSHIIEHFNPKDLVEFMTFYLSKLKEGGTLVILTPLNSPYFYDDFDHIKPYHPDSIQMMFGAQGAQVKFTSEKLIHLKALWFRKSPWLIRKTPALYLSKKPYSWLVHAWNLGATMACKMTFGLLGRKDGWLGIYTKVSTSS